MKMRPLRKRAFVHLVSHAKKKMKNYAVGNLERYCNIVGLPIAIIRRELAKSDVVEYNGFTICRYHDSEAHQDMRDYGLEKNKEEEGTIVYIPADSSDWSKEDKKFDKMRAMVLGLKGK